MEHETAREQLEGEVNHLTQLLQGALRKQDEMALEAADAWQKVRRKSWRRIKNNFQVLTINNLPSYNLQPFIYISTRRGIMVLSGRPCRSW